MLTARSFEDGELRNAETSGAKWSSIQTLLRECIVTDGMSREQEGNFGMVTYNTTAM